VSSARPTLTFPCGLYDRMLPLYTGDVKSDAFPLRFEAIDEPRVLFDRLVREEEFDAAEFSASEHVSRLCAKVREFVAIPAFPSRLFRHGFVAINRKTRTLANWSRCRGVSRVRYAGRSRLEPHSMSLAKVMADKQGVGESVVAKHLGGSKRLQTMRVLPN
jgi:hypothetical protein